MGRDRAPPPPLATLLFAIADSFLKKRFSSRFTRDRGFVQNKKCGVSGLPIALLGQEAVNPTKTNHIMSL